MEQQIFCDGIGRISIIGGVVRLDLFTFSPSETDANGSPRPVLTHRIVMGTDGFLRSSEKVMEAVQAIGRQRQAPAPAQGQPSPTQAAPAPQWPPQGAPPAAPKPAAPVQPAPVQPAPQPKPTEPPPSRPPFP
jgi:hypothetical protein